MNTLVTMTCGKLLIFLFALQVSASDWVSEWMNPIQEQFDESPPRRNSNAGSLKLYEDEYQRMAPFYRETTEPPPSYFVPRTNSEQSTAGLKMKLEATLESAKMLAEALNTQIAALTLKEIILKEAITNGRAGVSTVTVSTVDQIPRSYIIRDGLWTLCTGVIQPPTAGSMFKGLGSTPRCYGQEVPTSADPCVFNSVIKYETIPIHRRLQYIEEDYLCLKPSFNGTLEQYMSVPKRLMNDTCTNGVIRSLEENVLECGLRVLSEYSYYPTREFAPPALPLDYCTEQDGSCRLIVAWHVSNSTIENFEFLKNEQNFKKYFIKSGSFIK